MQYCYTVVLGWFLALASTVSLRMGRAQGRVFDRKTCPWLT
jgi:hypothetical protein